LIGAALMDYQDNFLAPLSGSIALRLLFLFALNLFLAFCIPCSHLSFGRYISWLGSKFSCTFNFSFASSIKNLKKIEKWKKGKNIKTLVVVESTNVLQEEENKT
jgi:hypothetical protein